MEGSYQEIIDILRDFTVLEAYLFGSYIKNPQSAHDIDIAVALRDKTELFRLAAKLESGLSKTIDICPLESNEKFSNYIRRQGVKIYG